MNRALLIGMTNPDRRLARHLAIAMLIKLAVLSLLWSVFIRHSRVSVDADVIGSRFGATISTQGASK